MFDLCNNNSGFVGQSFNENRSVQPSTNYFTFCTSIISWVSANYFFIIGSWHLRYGHQRFNEFVISSLMVFQVRIQIKKSTFASFQTCSPLLEELILSDTWDLLVYIWILCLVLSINDVCKMSPTTDCARRVDKGEKEKY